MKMTDKCVFTLGLSIVLSLSACAGLSVTKITGGPNSPDDMKAKGFRYYEAAPYLFIHPDGKGGVTGEIEWIPDPAQLKSVHPYAYLSTNDVTLKFTNGTLDEATSNVDETAVPSAILTAAASILKFSAAGIPETSTGVAPSPYLFRIVNTGTGVVLKGGPIRPDILIKATVSAQGAGQ